MRGLVAEHSGRIRKQIDLREADEVGRLEAEYQSHPDELAASDAGSVSCVAPIFTRILGRGGAWDEAENDAMSQGLGGDPVSRADRLLAERMCLVSAE